MILEFWQRDGRCFGGECEKDMHVFFRPYWKVILMPFSLSHLQKDLNLGLNCVKTLWRHETKGWITSVYAADIDQDGDVEVLASARTGRVYALSKDGDLLWSSKVVTKA